MSGWAVAVVGSGWQWAESEEELTGPAEEVAGPAEEVAGSGKVVAGSGKEVVGSGKLVVGSGKVVAVAGRVEAVSVGELAGSEEVAAVGWVEQEWELVLGETAAGAEVPVPASDQAGTGAVAVRPVAVAGAAVVLDLAVGVSVKTVNAAAVLTTVPSVAAGQERNRSKGCMTGGILVADGLDCSTGSNLTWSQDVHLQRHTTGSVHNPAVLDHLCWPALGDIQCPAIPRMVL